VVVLVARGSPEGPIVSPCKHPTLIMLPFYKRTYAQLKLTNTFKARI